MIKNIKTIAGVKSLGKAEQKAISGGNFGSGCQTILIECFSDYDCPCNRRCGFVTPAGAGVDNICELP